jgi:hypothetical protein
VQGSQPARPPFCRTLRYYILPFFTHSRFLWLADSDSPQNLLRWELTLYRRP